MEKRKVKRVSRNARLNVAEKERLNEIERQAQRDFPPAAPTRPPLPRTGVAATIRRARQARNLTWYAVAQLAGIPNSNTVRDIEAGVDCKLSNVEAVARALGLKLEAVEAES